MVLSIPCAACGYRMQADLVGVTFKQFVIDNQGNSHAAPDGLVQHLLCRTCAEYFRARVRGPRGDRGPTAGRDGGAGRAVSSTAQLPAAAICACWTLGQQAWCRSSTHTVRSSMAMPISA